MKRDKLFRKIKEISAIAKWILLSLVLLFILSRGVVALIMTGILPAFLFFHAGGFHIHHYVYGIFLSLTLSTYLLFRQHKPHHIEEKITAFIYGIGLGLLLDEFMMWLTMTNDYYSKFSIDAIIVVVSLLSMTWLFPKLRKIGVDTWWEYLLMWLIAIVIGIALTFVFSDIYVYLKPIFDKWMATSPP